MARKIILSTLLLILILGTTSFASGSWNFDYEKSVYYDVAENFNNLNYTYNGSFKAGMFSETFIEQFFSQLKLFLDESDYSQSDYPHLLVCRPGSNYILVYLIKSIGNPNDYRIFTGTNIELTYYFNSDFTFNKIIKTNNGYSNADTARYQSKNSKPEGMYLSEYNGTYGNISNSYVPYFTSSSKYGIQFSSNIVDNINLNNFNNNFILNKEFIIGNNYNFTINYYYLDSDNNKVDITPYITLNETEYWYGVDYSPFINPEYKENLSEEKEYYMELIITGKNGISNFRKEYIEMVFTTMNKNKPPIPDNSESGDTGGGTTTPSGDSGGGIGGDNGSGTTNEKLDNINNQLENTNNKLDNISGELSNINNNLTTVPDIKDTTITNDDITSNLDFEFEQDPYTNFWLELTTGLGNAFTNNKREISIQFRDKTHIISLDNFSVQIPSALKPFLTIISTVFITWKMLQYIKIIIDNISSGNIDEVLEMNEEEGITNLF